MALPPAAPMTTPSGPHSAIPAATPAAPPRTVPGPGTTLPPAAPRAAAGTAQAVPATMPPLMPTARAPCLPQSSGSTGPIGGNSVARFRLVSSASWPAQLSIFSQVLPVSGAGGRSAGSLGAAACAGGWSRSPGGVGADWEGSCGAAGGGSGSGSEGASCWSSRRVGGSGGRALSAVAAMARIASTTGIPSRHASGFQLAVSQLYQIGQSTRSSSSPEPAISGGGGLVALPAEGWPGPAPADGTSAHRVSEPKRDEAAEKPLLPVG